MQLRKLMSLLFAIGGLIPSTAPAEDWTQFRGPNASGIYTGSRSLPTKFSLKKNLQWSVTLGDGIGSPIVAVGRVFTTAMTGKEQFTLFCVDAEKGKILWKKSLKTGKLPRITPPNSHASSTPATDGERVYAYFSTLGLMAFDVKDGTELWQKPLPRPAYLMDWGAASSPIVHNGMVFFLQDDDLNPFLIAVDAKTGTQRWRTPRLDMLAGYATPVLCKANGRTDVVIAGSGKMKGYDPKTGKELWTCNSLLRTIMTTPVVRNGIIYIAVQSYGDSARTLKYALMEWLDTNQDGKLVKAEVPKEFWKKFDRSDKNGDKALEGDEMDTAFQSPANQVGGGNIIQAIKGGGRGDVTKTHLLWSLKHSAPSNLSSPLVVGKELFVIKKGGICSCFDAGSGKTHWLKKRVYNFGQYYASPIAGDGKIYIVGENGFVIVMAQGPKMKILAKNDLEEQSLATPAIANGSILIRTRTKLLCFASPSK